MKKTITRVDALNLAIAALSDNADAVEVLTSIRDTIAKACVPAAPSSPAPTP